MQLSSTAISYRLQNGFTHKNRNLLWTISMGAAKQTGEHFSAMVDCIQRYQAEENNKDNIAALHILLTGELQRHNLMAKKISSLSQQKLDEKQIQEFKKESLEAALKLDEQWLIENKDALEKLRQLFGNNFVIKKWNEYLKLAGESIKQVQVYYETELSIRQGFKKCVLTKIMQIHEKFPDLTEQADIHLREFIFEECGVLIFLSKDGTYKYELYAGERSKAQEHTYKEFGKTEFVKHMKLIDEQEKNSKTTLGKSDKALTKRADFKKPANHNPLVSAELLDDTQMSQLQMIDAAARKVPDLPPEQQGEATKLLTRLTYLNLVTTPNALTLGRNLSAPVNSPSTAGLKLPEGRPRSSSTGILGPQSIFRINHSEPSTDPISALDQKDVKASLPPVSTETTTLVSTSLLGTQSLSRINLMEVPTDPTINVVPEFYQKDAKVSLPPVSIETTTSVNSSILEPNAAPHTSPVPSHVPYRKPVKNIDTQPCQQTDAPQHPTENKGEEKEFKTPRTAGTLPSIDPTPTMIKGPKQGSPNTSTKPYGLWKGSSPLPVAATLPAAATPIPVRKSASHDELNLQTPQPHQPPRGKRRITNSDPGGIKLSVIGIKMPRHNRVGSGSPRLPGVGSPPRFIPTGSPPTPTQRSKFYPT